MNQNLYAPVPKFVKRKASEWAADMVFTLETMPAGRFKTINSLAHHHGQPEYLLQSVITALVKTNDLNMIELLQGGFKRHGLMSKMIDNAIEKLSPKKDPAPVSDKGEYPLSSTMRSRKLLNIVNDVKEENVVSIPPADHPWRETANKTYQESEETRPKKALTTNEAQKCFMLFLRLDSDQRNKVLSLVQTYESLGGAA